MMNQSVELSLEQQFKKRRFADRVKSLSREEIEKLSIELYKQMMLKENMYKALVKEEWGIGSDSIYS
ncbi:MAG: NblA/ycf18 family protein [Prochloraceae cyanobacterium]